MEKRICVMLGTEESSEPLQRVFRTYNQKAPEIGILGDDGNGRSSASLIIVTYEGKGTFSIRSKKGSRINILGDRGHGPYLLE